MSTALSNVEVCNLALDLLRQSEKLTSLETPESEIESLASRWYDVTRRSVLEAFPWGFARKRGVLSRNATDPAFGYSDAYNLPNDFVALCFVGDNYKDDYIKDFSIEDGQIVLDNDGATSLNVMYIYDITDVSKFSPMFVSLMAAELAVVFANAITGLNKSIKEMVAYRDRIEAKARSVHAKQNPLKVRYESMWEKARRKATTGQNITDGTHLFS